MLTHNMHVHILFYSYTFIGGSDSLDLHIQVFACYLIDQIFREDQGHLEEPELSYSIIFFLSLLYSYRFHDSVHCTEYSFYLFIYLLSLY